MEQSAYASDMKSPFYYFVVLQAMEAGKVKQDELDGVSHTLSEGSLPVPAWAKGSPWPLETEELCMLHWDNWAEETFVTGYADRWEGMQTHS